MFLYHRGFFAFVFFFIFSFFTLLVSIGLNSLLLPPVYENIVHAGFIHLVRTQNFPKSYNFLAPDRIRRCTFLGVRKISLSENFANVQSE